jgi:hypothetical protein
MTETEVATPPAPFGRALFFAVVLIVMDAFVLNQGVLAMLVGIWMLLVALPRTFLAKKFAAVRGPRLRNIATYLAAACAVFVLNGLNNSIAQDRADVLVSAVKQFHSKHQRYPRSLDELVPEFLHAVPLAKHTLSYNRFVYMTSDDDTVLFYVNVPPFGRPTYSFARNEWGYLD